MKPEKPEQSSASGEPVFLLFQKFIQPELRRPPFGVIEAGAAKRPQALQREMAVSRPSEQLVEIGCGPKLLPALKDGEVKRRFERLNNIRPRFTSRRGGEPRQTSR